MAVLAAIPAITSAMGTIGTIASVAGAGLGLIGSMRQASAIKAAGKARQAEANYRAEQARIAAGQERASAQRKAINEEREGRLLESSLLATAAATGQSSSENVLNIMGDLDYETRYRKSLSLFEGEKSAKEYEQSALLSEYEGAEEMRAAKTEASSVRLQGVSDFATSMGGVLYNKYSPKTTGSGKKPDIVKWRQGGSSVVGYY